MKKLIFWCLAFLGLMSGPVSCTNEVLETVGENTAEVLNSNSSSVDLTQYLPQMRAFSDDYLKRPYPADRRMSAIQQAVFAAVYSAALTPEIYGYRDNYAPIYQTWRVASDNMADMLRWPIYKPTEYNSFNPEGSAENLISPSVVIIRPNPTIHDTLLDYGQNAGSVYLANILSSLEDRFYKVDENERYNKVIDIANELFPGPEMDRTLIFNHLRFVSDRIDLMTQYMNPSRDPHRPYQGCWTLMDGIDFTHSDRELPAGWGATMEYLLPVIFGLGETSGNVYNEALSCVMDFGSWIQVINRQNPDFPYEEYKQIAKQLSLGVWLYEIWSMLMVDSEEFLVFDPAELTVPKEGGTFNVTVNTSGHDLLEWQITGKSDFLTISKVPGSPYYNPVYSITVAPNNTQYERNGEVTFKSSFLGLPDKEFVLKVDQQGPPYFNLLTERTVFDYNGGRKSIQFETNMDWAIDIQQYSWIRIGGLMEMPGGIRKVYELNFDLQPYNCTSCSQHSIIRSAVVPIRLNYNGDIRYEILEIFQTCRGNYGGIINP